MGQAFDANEVLACCPIVWSLLYSYSFEQKSDWTREYPGQEEILEYLYSVAAKYGLYKHIRFNTTVESSTWDPATSKWRTKVQVAEGTKDAEFETATDGTKGQYTISSDFLISAVGQLNMPKYPDIPGLGDYEGKVMHSARWDWGFDLAGKKVALIGNGRPWFSPILKRALISKETSAVYFTAFTNWV